ncbi:unnamed protein product [Meloidogyne enterolobii]|uniref:Uncharacterized protein n=1 Tax=Meloidogyne enterolobii TaxID=390850 RepID=A0ACB1A4H9_MELEN
MSGENKNNLPSRTSLATYHPRLFTYLHLQSSIPFHTIYRPKLPPFLPSMHSQIFL